MTQSPPPATNSELPITAQRDFAVSVVRRLREAGCEAMWAGGCVRDALLGKQPKDYDVATNAEPNRVREVFGRKRTIAVGAAFGVITVLGPNKGAGQVEVATFRSDGAYADGRRPESIRFTSAEEDARRRDFTINGLFYDPTEERVIDYVGGRDDLVAGVVRAIGVADERFGEDRLRMLRAVRFAASLRFELDPTTAEAIRRHAPGLPDVSPERIGVEVRRMLTETDPPRALRLLEETTLLPHALPPLAKTGVADAAARLARLSLTTAPLALAVALIDAVDPAEAAATARALKWTNKEVDRTAWLIDHRSALAEAESRPWSTIQPLLAHAGGKELVEVHRANNGDPSTIAFCEERLGWAPERLDPPPLIGGAELIAAGAKPGPGFGKLLAQARAAQLDGQVVTPAEAIALLGL